MRFFAKCVAALRVFDKFYFWIRNILSSAWISIVVNGALVGYFSCFNWVRQSDPFSPLLFGIVEDFLSWSFLWMVNDRELSPMQVGDAILGHFDTWKGHSLSYAGRVCLVSLVITSKFV